MNLPFPPIISLGWSVAVAAAAATLEEVLEKWRQSFEDVGTWSQWETVKPQRNPLETKMNPIQAPVYGTYRNKNSTNFDLLPFK